ncbi:MAG TPA: UDP-glucose 4-epimerase GalE [Acidimicrobiales bacterium]|nr:UDP-glucose 4-epimerase GalE [Acidimicrobiales bacterium]
MRILVTGGAGYIGSVVATRLLELGHTVTVLDDLSTGHADAVPPGATFVEGRVHDAAVALAGERFDGAVHLAASSLVAESIANPEKYRLNNVVGTRLLLDTLLASGVPAIVFSSTAAVYGEPETVPIDEDAPTRPVNPYGESKLAVDEMLAAEAATGRIGAVSLRYFNVAGAYAGRGERHDPETHLVPIALQAALGTRAGLVVYGDDYPTPDGTCVRDYIHVADLAEAHLGALASARPGAHRVFNLGNGAGFSVREVLAAVERVTGVRLEVTVAGRRAGDPAVLVASAARARRELGWTPARPSLEQMIGDAWDVLRSGSDPR